MMRVIGRMLMLVMLGLALVAQAQGADKIKVLIVNGQSNHKWMATTPVLKATLEQAGIFEVEVATTPPNGAPKEDWDKFRPRFADYKVVLVNYNDYFKGPGKGDQWPAVVQKALEKYMARGGGLVIYHSANNAFPTWVEWNKMIGMNWQPKTFGDALKIVDGKVVRIPKGEGPNASHGRQHDYECQVLDKDHPITKGMPAKWIHHKDELYHGQRGPALNVNVLVYAYSDPTTGGTGSNEPLVYTVKYGKGRVFVNLMADNVPQLSQPDMAALMTRGAEWAATGKVTLGLPADFK